MLNYKWKWWISRNMGQPITLNLCTFETYFPNILKQTHHFVRNVLECQLAILKHPKNPTMHLSTYARANWLNYYVFWPFEDWAINCLCLFYWTLGFGSPVHSWQQFSTFCRRNRGDSRDSWSSGPTSTSSSAHPTVPGTGERWGQLAVLPLRCTGFSGEDWFAVVTKSKTRGMGSTVLGRTTCGGGDHGNSQRRHGVGARLHRLRGILKNK